MENVVVGTTENNLVLLIGYIFAGYCGRIVYLRTASFSAVSSR